MIPGLYARRLTLPYRHIRRSQKTSYQFVHVVTSHFKQKINKNRGLIFAQLCKLSAHVLRAASKNGLGLLWKLYHTKGCSVTAFLNTTGLHGKGAGEFVTRKDDLQSAGAFHQNATRDTKATALESGLLVGLMKVTFVIHSTVTTTVRLYLISQINLSQQHWAKLQAKLP